MSLSPEIPFKLDIPIEVFEKSGEEGKERRISGIISTEHRDKQGEVVLQRGLDFDDFLSNGWFNDNHSKDTCGILGYPERVEKTTFQGKPATRVEGFLLKGSGDKRIQADRIWDTAQALQKTDRRLGFSIEGKVVRRAGHDGKVIAKARVTNVAITNCPVNAVTGMDILAKSMMAMEGNQEAIDALKALTAGVATSAPAEATPGDGFALRGESVESDEKDLKPKKKKKKRYRLSKAEAIEVIQNRYPGMSDRDAEKVWRWAKHRGAKK